MKIGYQLKQVRERLAKGLVDKGILRTEKRNFLLFDMATHPIADMNAKEDVMRRTLSLLTARTAAVPPQALQKENVRYRHMRAVALVCAGMSPCPCFSLYVSSHATNATNPPSQNLSSAARSLARDYISGGQPEVQGSRMVSLTPQPTHRASSKTPSNDSLMIPAKPHSDDVTTFWLNFAPGHSD